MNKGPGGNVRSKPINSKGFPAMTISFIVGQSYATRSACDHDTIYAYVIERRTEKSVWIKTMEGKVERRTINTYDGVETFKPHGRYSMSATISADRTEEDVRAPDVRRDALRAVAAASAIEHKQELVEQRPALRPYQADLCRSITATARAHLATAPVIEVLKQNVGVVAAIDNRFDRATAFVARFAGSFPDQKARTDHIRTVLNIISLMSLDDFAELAEIRRYLRGE